MFQQLRKHLGYANVTATLALFFAMSGGALAASHYLITSTRQIKPSVLSSLKGKSGATGATGASGTTGATGPGGPQGPQGAAGTSGTNGTNGEPGKNGESVVSKAFNGEKEKCKEGGSEFTAAEGKKTYACNGEQGVIHPGETLPPEASEYGAWAVAGISSQTYAYATASFTVPLAAPLVGEETPCELGTGCPVHYIDSGGDEVTESAGALSAPAACSGNAEDPTAAPGNFCMYEDTPEIGDAQTNSSKIRPTGHINPGVGTAGAVVEFEITGSRGVVRGSWAVTAPAAP